MPWVNCRDNQRYKKMKIEMMKFVKEHVHTLYWEQDLNCASTTLQVLSEYFDFVVEKQVIDSAIGMHGAGGYQAQCGIVEGTLMFIGILGRAQSIPDPEIVSFCKKFAQSFEAEFTSLGCKILRPEGFKPENPPHLCETLTVNGIIHSITLVANLIIEKIPIQKTNE